MTAEKPAPAPIRCLVVDDHAVVRDGLAAIIELEEGMEVVARAKDGREAVQRFRDHHPDVTLMDLNMLALSGGRERTDEEFRDLFESADLRLEASLPTPSGLSVIEALPA